MTHLPPLPFAFEVTPLPRLAPGASSPLLLAVETLEALGSEDSAYLDGIVTAFASLLEAGGLGGDTVPPSDSDYKDHRELGAGPKRCAWEFDEIFADERALTCLANLLHHAHARVPLTRVLVTTDRVALARQVSALPEGTDPEYPPVWPKPPFPVHTQLEGSDSILLEMQLSRVPSADEQEALEDALLSFLPGAAIGAFSEPGSSGSLYCSGDEVVFVDDEVSWELIDVRFDMAALDILTNICMAYHYRHLPVLSLSFS